MSGSEVAQIGIEYGCHDPRQRNTSRGKRYFSIRTRQKPIALQLDQLGDFFSIPIVFKSPCSSSRGKVDRSIAHDPFDHVGSKRILSPQGVAACDR